MNRPSRALAALAVAACAVSLSPAAEIIRGVYLQTGTADSIVVRWRTDTPTVSTVIYGKSAQLTGTPVEGPDAGIFDTLQQDPEPTTEHEVTLAGLEPNTRYYYAVGYGSGPTLTLLAGNDSGHYFETAPPAGQPKPTRIWVLGDSGELTQAQTDVRDAYYELADDVAGGGAAARHTDLWLMLGDNAYTNGTDQQYQDKMFAAYGAMLPKSVLWSTVGNHDLADEIAGTYPYFDLFTLPEFGEAGGAASNEEDYYSLDYGNLHVLSLDSENSDRTPPAAMLDWLEADLASTSADWIIAIWHHPPYSKGSHDSDDPLDSDGKMQDMRLHAVELLEDYGVDLVLSGHSHSYERSFLIDGHYGTSDTFTEAMKIDAGTGDPTGDGAYVKPYRGDVPYGPAPGDGTVYVVAGSSSKLSTGVSEALNGPVGAPSHPAMVSSIWDFGSVVLDVNGNQLDAVLLDDQGLVRDRFRIVKGDPAVPPVADLGGAPLKGNVPLAVSFTDLSLNAPTRWRWDFNGDGVDDNGQPNPVHVFTEPGLYTVGLGVSNVAGEDGALRADWICATDGPPAAITGLALAGDRETVSWTPDPRATTYQAMKGDLIALVGSAGDFATSGTSCLPTDDSPATSDPATPAAGQAWFYLARGVNCAPETGSFDGDGAGLIQSRDLALQGEAAPCACVPGADPDQDGFCDLWDNCPDVAAQDLTDADADGLGDACDLCPADPLNDPDGDGACQDVDNCPELANPDQTDSDGDDDGNACDPDDDNDGVADDDDAFPLDPLACRDDDADGCDDCSGGAPDPANDGPDYDADGTCDLTDTCFDADGDGLGTGAAGNAGCLDATTDSDDDDPLRCSDVDGDLCDDCVLGSWDPTQDGDDPDVDGICSLSDNCPAATNPGQADFDDDGTGDVCDSCTDLDQDAFGDPGFPQNSCPLDNCPEDANPSQLDSDQDGEGDACDFCPFDADNDVDQDFVCGDVDNCPLFYNLNQTDQDGDGRGDACDACQLDAYDDQDGDQICGDVDNCPTVPNPGQLPSAIGGVGEACRYLWIDADFYVSATEVTNREYCDFLNAVAQIDLNGLFDTRMESDPRGGIDRLLAGGILYVPRPNMADKPVNFVAWLDAARYVNWLANGRPAGLQGPATTETGVYNLQIQNPGGKAQRAPGATWFLPTRAEWNQAAYADPQSGTEWLYPSRANLAPTQAGATPTGGVANPGPQIANYGSGADWAGQNGHVVTVAGAGSRSVSGWGTYDQGGNVAEWVEDPDGQPSDCCVANGTPGCTDPVCAQAICSQDIFCCGVEWDQTCADAALAEPACDDGCLGATKRFIRGGSFQSAAGPLRSTASDRADHTVHSSQIGFRVAAFWGCIDVDGDGAGWPGTPACASGVATDNCPDQPNADQADIDGDGLGDACDPDTDGDGVPNAADCAPDVPAISAPPQPAGDTLSLARQGTSAALSWLPTYQGRLAHVYRGSAAYAGPAESDCWVASTAAGTATDESALPTGGIRFYFATAVNLCGEQPSGGSPACLDPGHDTDADGWLDVADGCPLDGDAGQLDADADGVGDACDNCPVAYNPDQSDADADGAGDVCAPAG